MFVKCLEVLTNSQSLLGSVFYWDWFLDPLTEINWYMLGLWRTFESDWWISTCFLCSRSLASWRLLWWRGFRILVASRFWKKKLSCVFFNSSWYSKPRLRISGLLWRYLYFNHQRSCRFEYFNSSHRFDLDMIVKSCLQPRCFENPGLWNTFCKKKKTVSIQTDSLMM